MSKPDVASALDFAARLRPPGEAVENGEAWQAFVDAIADAGRVVTAAHVPCSPVDRAEG